MRILLVEDEQKQVITLNRASLKLDILQIGLRMDYLVNTKLFRKNTT